MTFNVSKCNIFHLDNSNLPTLRDRITNITILLLNSLLSLSIKFSLHFADFTFTTAIKISATWDKLTSLHDHLNQSRLKHCVKIYFSSQVLNHLKLSRMQYYVFVFATHATVLLTVSCMEQEVLQWKAIL
jgi:hypothetical protein